MTANLPREFYLSQLKGFINKPVIKVITGMRRSGKSFFLRQIIDELIRRKIPKKNILYIDKELAQFDQIKTYKDLNNLVTDYFCHRKGKKYICVDEVQLIVAWEKSINNFLKQGDTDIYITGSNAQMLSSELATLIAGRYVEFEIYPLSFSEFLEFRKKKSQRLGLIDEEFELYINYGGLPGIHEFEFDEKLILQYIDSVYNTILFKDIIKRHQIRNSALLENLIHFIADNIGNLFSSKSIVDFLKAQKITTAVNTIQSYLNSFEDSYLAHKVKRYDIRGKKFFEIRDKYFLGDLGLRTNLLGFKKSHINGILENLVYLDLVRRGYKVSVGSLGNLEVDFIAENKSEKLYIQVCYMLTDDKAATREFAPLEMISDNYPKLVLSMDRIWGQDRNGIQRKNIIDFLLERPS
jgi:predicted AAA+ superfamily ATPase